jgi:hypothetical protein
MSAVKLRMCPTFAIIRGVMRAPVRKPAKYAEPLKPTSNVDMPNSTARNGKKVICRPCPASKNAVVNRREETERRLPMIVISKCKKETRILVRFVLGTSTIFGKFWQIFSAQGARP